MSIKYKAPSGWESNKLGSLCTKITDGTHKTPDYRDAGVVFISAKNVRDGKLNFSDHKYISHEEHEFLTKRCKPETGDVMLSKSGSLGDSVVVPKLEFEFSIFESLALMKVKKKKVSPEYLMQILNSPLAKKYFWSITTGLAVKHLHLGDLKKMPILLPSPPEQEAIIDSLSIWDEAIEKTQRLIQAKKRQLRQMSRWLLFGHKRLDNQKNELADAHFFKYPSDWALVKIGKVSKEVSGRNGESEETVLSCSKYDGFVNSLDYFGKQVFSSDTSNYKVVKKGQFGYPSNHVEEGSIGLLEHCEKGIVSPIYVVFEASKGKVHSPYLYKLLKTDIYRHIFQVSTSSSVDRRGSLRWGDFSKIKVLVPPLEEQQKISETLSSVRHEIDLLKQLAEKYKTQKRGLMQKMLTGEWRILPDVVKTYEEM